MAGFVAALCCNGDVRASDLNDLDYLFSPLGPIRPYLQLNVGRAYFTDTEGGNSLDLQTRSSEPILGGAGGLQFGRHVGVEISVQNTETETLAPGDSKIGEYSLWTFLAQLRLGYPVWDDRLTPYALVGVGMALGEFNDRNVNSVFPDVGDRQSTSFAGAVGAGIEYFVAPNVAFGAQAKYLFVPGLDVTVGGRQTDLDLDHVAVTGDMRILFDEIAGGRQAASVARAPAKDSEGIRGYVAIRGGIGAFTDSDPAPMLSIDNPSGVLGSVAVGLNANKYLGLELAADYTETNLSVDGIGDVAEYSLWTSLVQGRARYPLLGDRLTPYVVAGGGFGFGEINDKSVPTRVSGIGGDRDTTGVGAVGAGFDYFLAENVAVNVELKHVFLFGPEIERNGRPLQLDLDPVFASAGLRILFP